MSAAWEAVESTLRKHYWNPDTQAARALYAAAAIHHYTQRPPVWLMLIAPPGSMKTQLLDALTGIPGVHPVDMVTKNTFLSGQIAHGKNRPSSSLLHRIGPKGIITFADFSTILGMRWDDCNTIFSQCRRIFDGRMNREYGTNDGDTEWEGFVTFLAACTAGIERFQMQMKGLGERFIQIAMPRSATRAVRAAIGQEKASCSRDLSAAVRNLLAGIPDRCPTMPESYMDRTAFLAEFVGFCRTPIHRNNKGQIDSVIEVETATRLGESLAQLGKGSAALDGRTEVNESDFALMVRCAFDCIPEARRIYLRWLISSERGFLPLRGSLLSFTREELSELGVAEGEMLTEEFQSLVDRAYITPANCQRPKNLYVLEKTVNQ